MTAATIYMSLMGAEGLRSVASACHKGMVDLLSGIADVPGVNRKFSGPVFHEVVLELPGAAKDVLASMADDGILGGYDLGEVSPELANCMLTNVTEVHSGEDIQKFVRSLASATGGA